MSNERVQFNPVARSGFKKRKDKSHLKCGFCGKTRHVKASCFRLVGFPKWWGNNKGNNSFNKPRSTMNNVDYQEQGDADTPLDHAEEVVNFANYEEFAGNFCANLSNANELPDDTVRIVKSGGDVKLSNIITLLDYLFVPTFNYNLLSDTRYQKVLAVKKEKA
ncbi:hypothetical protein LIER_18484 [Lithospermum erythrorhizon]|uniref:Gag-pol polyprotein n=1 Tax=Lithospermum erythrorhizon TaxID=34254 RepID=A0AAV3QE45_LITER